MSSRHGRIEEALEANENAPERTRIRQAERELLEVEDKIFGDGRNGLRPRADRLIDEIAELSAAVDTLDESRFHLERAARIAKYEEPTNGHDRWREQQLLAEWERWRYRRSKLPPERRGRMMKIGQRQCRWCEEFFWPSTLRQRYCQDTCRILAHKRKGS